MVAEGILFMQIREDLLRPSTEADAAKQPLFTEKELADYLSISVAACRKWRLQRRGPMFIKLGSLVRYRRDDVDQWLATRPQGGGTTSAKEAIGGVQ